MMPQSAAIDLKLAPPLASGALAGNGVRAGAAPPGRARLARILEQPLTRVLARLASLSMAASFFVATAAPSFAASISIARDTEIEEFFYDQTRPVFKAAGLDPNSVTMYLVNDDQINAFVAGGQNIFVFSGIIDKLETPNELLGVVAHETGHIAGGHLSRSSEDMTNEIAPFLITMLAGLAAALAGEAQAGMGIIAGAQQAMQRAVLGYTRIQENSADQAAITFLDKIHKSGRGMLKTFEMLADQELLPEGMQDPYARSHPLSQDRIASLEDRVEKSPYKDVPDTPEDIARYNLIRAKVRGFVNRPDITLRHYPLSDQSEPALYARAIAYYRTPDFASANHEIDALLRLEPKNPYFWELKGQILAEQRDFRGAVAAFENSVKMKPNAPLLEVNLGATLLAVGDAKMLPRARDMLEASLRSDPSNAFAWYQLSFIYADLGNEGLASLAVAEQKFNLGAYEEALRFAMRAKKLLPAGSRDADRADDIIAISVAQMPKDRRGKSGGELAEPSQHSLSER